MLTNDIYALFNTLILAILPFGDWLAASIIALVTLRKGLKTGGLLLVAAVFTSFFMLNTTLSPRGAMVSALIAYAPCYLAAAALYLSQSWRIVCGILFFQVLLVSSLLQMLLPEYIMQQYLYIREILNQLPLENTFLILGKNASSTDQTIFANYLVGVQATGVALASLVSLTLARLIQAKLYYPEGFQLEMRAIRGTKIDLFILLTAILAAKYHYTLGMNVLPVLLLFFFIAGLSLWFDYMKKRSSSYKYMLVLSIVLGFFPQILLSVYILLGALDTMFNFRLYLHASAGNTMREVK